MEELQDQILIEFIKFLFSTGLLFFTWIVGQQIISYWDAKKKRQEFDISTSAQFQQIYGEAKQINRLWRIYVESLKKRRCSKDFDLEREMLQRAVATESKIEGIIVKLATERLLSEKEIETLGLLRKAFQVFRDNISDGEGLTFIGSEPGYRLFQILVCEAAWIISSGKYSNKITSKRAQENLREITKYSSSELRKKAERLAGI